MADTTPVSHRGRLLSPERAFESSRLSDGWVASAYELIVPAGRRRLPGAGAHDGPPGPGQLRPPAPPAAGAARRLGA